MTSEERKRALMELRETLQIMDDPDQAGELLGGMISGMEDDPQRHRDMVSRWLLAVHHCIDLEELGKP